MTLHRFKIVLFIIIYEVFVLNHRGFMRIVFRNRDAVGDYRILLKGRNFLRYEQNGDYVQISEEYSAEPFGVVAFINSIDIWAISKKPVSDSEKDQIIKNLIVCFKEKDINLIIV